MMQIQKDENGEPISGVKDLFAKDLKLREENDNLPKDVISPSKVRGYKRIQKNKKK
jgi:hypothetical protein